MIDYIDISKYSKVNEWISKTLPGVNFYDSISPNQISSKIWMISELKEIIDSEAPLNVEIVGGWFGWPLIGMLYETFNIKKIFMYDIDKNACRVAIQYREIYNKNKNDVWILNEDYWDRSPKRHEPDLVINCSSEHMKETFCEMKGKNVYLNLFYNEDPVVVIQSNNMRHIPEHINCVDSIEHLINVHQINKVLYSGERDIVEWQDTTIKSTNYKRFMVIGKL